jgi:archaellum biogenesis protein FlaJ (TadC family)
MSEKKEEPTHEELKRWYEQDIASTKVMNFFWSMIAFTIVLTLYSILVVIAQVGIGAIYAAPTTTEEWIKPWFLAAFTISRDVVFVYICWHFVSATLFNFKEEIVAFVKKTSVFIRAGNQELSKQNNGE